MRIYSVGGAVRDELLGLPVQDRDYVVVGASPAQMIERGFKQVGRDFPVFLHPETHEEYALARTERKSGRGYAGFSFDAAPDVTLEEDLARRDLTINAIARADDGSLTDPFDGVADLEARVLRHVGPAFVEDPVRLLRIARFAARFTGFSVAPGTVTLMREMVGNGEADHLVAERVWQEIARGLMENKPSRMFAVLRECGALARLLPELDRLFGVPQRAEFHPEIDTGVHVMMALDYAAKQAYALPVRFAVLGHDFGKGLTPADVLPRHPGTRRTASALSTRCARACARRPNAAISRCSSRAITATSAAGPSCARRRSCVCSSTPTHYAARSASPSCSKPAPAISMVAWVGRTSRFLTLTSFRAHWWPCVRLTRRRLRAVARREQSGSASTRPGWQPSNWPWRTANKPVHNQRRNDAHPVYLEYAERPQGLDHARRVPPALPRANGRYHQGRADACGFRRRQSELENPGDR